MTPEQLKDSIKYGLAPERSQKIGSKLRLAYTLQEAADFGHRFEKALRNFDEIIRVAGYERRPGQERLSNPILLIPNYTDPVLGTGEISARVRMNDARTFASTTFTLDTSKKSHQLGQEFLSTAGSILQGSMEFRNSPSGAWIRHCRLYSDRDAGARLLELIGEHEIPKLVTAEHTQVMLWDAMQDPKRNWGMASTAQEAFQGLAS